MNDDKYEIDLSELIRRAWLAKRPLNFMESKHHGSKTYENPSDRRARRKRERLNHTLARRNK